MRIRALFARIVRQFIRDKRTLALLIIAPLFVLTLLSLVFNGKTYHPKVGLVDLPAPIQQSFKHQTHLDTKEITLSKAKKQLYDKVLDAYVFTENNKIRVELEGSNPSTNQLILKNLQETLALGSQTPMKNHLSIHYLHGKKDLTNFDNFGPVFIGFFGFFFVFLIAGVSFLRERTTGTLERLLASPLRRYEVVAGYVMGFGFFAFLQTVILSLYAIYVLNMLMAGSIFYVLLLSLLTAFVALTLGTLLSSFANNELQMIQFIPLIIVPQFFFSGIFNLDTMSSWISWIHVITPLYYVANGLKDVMIRGYGWGFIGRDVYVLLGFGIVFMILNVITLKKHRRI